MAAGDKSKNNKRKKHHDKDKYYNLAKEQGLRSRAAFKLSQINRQYPILDNAKVVLDLCAAPGGWTQIASRVCGGKAQIIAVDILPIRGGLGRNVTTIVGDITTDKCKADINRAIMASSNNSSAPRKNNADSAGLVDVVLHDGAPNVGASYEKDAYVQLELSVHALRCATQHLKRNGTFITKIYRSRDSTSYQWVVQQLFKEVTSFKPKASRQQSAEIFYICQGYYKPEKIDPKLLDPKHIFEYVEGDTTGGSGTITANSKNFHVFHKQWDQQKRFRDGYDTEHYDFTMRHIEPLSNFIQAKGKMEAIQLLSTCTGFSFRCSECQDDNKNKTKNKDKKSSSPSPSCHCQLYLHHPLTTSEIKECVVDLKVLNKGDFKTLMIWREKMIQTLQVMKEDKEDKSDEDDDSDSDDDSDDDGDDKKEKGSDDEEDEIQKEITKLRLRKLREKKKIKKKERKIMAKKRRQAALGMDLNAIEIQQEGEEFFSLATLKSTKDLNQVSEVNLDQMTDEQVFGMPDKDDEDEDDNDKDNDDDDEDEDEKEKSLRRLEREMDDAYERYLESTKNGAAKSGTKKAKRSKKLMREKLAQESHEDQELLLTSSKQIDQDTLKYAELLQGGSGGSKDSDDDDDSSSDDDDSDDDDNDDDKNKKEESSSAPKKKKQKTNKDVDDSNPLLPKKREDPSSVKTARWFSNPLFAAIGETVEAATTEDKNASSSSSKKKKLVEEDDDDDDDEEDAPDMESSSDDDDDDEDDSDDDEEEGTDKKKKDKTKKKAQKKGLDASEVLSLIPKTDKQKRHELRIKAKARDERRQARKAKRLGESEKDFDLVPGEEEQEHGNNNKEDDDDDDSINRIVGMSEAKKQQLRDAKKLIKAGMGKNVDKFIQGKDDNQKGFEIVEQQNDVGPLPVMDDRKYDSEHEEYDSDDNARTMALGTMMLRRSKAKSLVDASYNRYAWNDPTDLPEWFVDDENRHYRPQLPIPKALLDKMKEKMIALSTKPIAKVAEARARKNKKARDKLAAAKKKAQAVSNSTEMSETMKLKAISKALRSNDKNNANKKKIVVAKKGGKPVKGAKMVDKRMKNDKRGMERAMKKKKGGKKGGLTGSKRRRHHS